MSRYGLQIYLRIILNEDITTFQQHEDFSMIYEKGIT